MTRYQYISMVIKCKEIEIKSREVYEMNDKLYIERCLLTKEIKLLKELLKEL